MPRLTVSIQTRNSAHRIQTLLDEVYTYADEVIVGVDANSVDDTFERIQGKVDVAYRFRHPGIFAPVRLLVTEYATGDWILSLDDDESMESGFKEIRDELLSQQEVTHFYFPKKHLISLSPCAYIRALPFFPDWQLRLFRNDASLLWKPPIVHSGYWMQGLGARDSRVSILHFQEFTCSPEQRAKKLEEYRLAGSDGSVEKGLTPVPGLPTAPASVRKPDPPSPPITRPIVLPLVRELTVAQLPGWKAHIKEVRMPTKVRPGSPIVADVLVRNIGTMAWTVHLGKWPFLNLAFRLLDEASNLLRRDGPRFPMPRQVAPNEEVLFLAAFDAPTERGSYGLEWDLVSEGECWFRETGSQTRLTPLLVE